MKRRMQRTLAGGLVVALFWLPVSGCFGNFSLTRKVYNWNKEVSENKFVRSLVMWGLFIIPVYGVSTCLDVVIFNLIETFTGKNPLAMNDGDTRVVERGEERAVIQRAGGRLYLTFYRNDVYAGTAAIEVNDRGERHATARVGGENDFDAALTGDRVRIEGTVGGRQVRQTLTGDQVAEEIRTAGLPLE